MLQVLFIYTVLLVLLVFGMADSQESHTMLLGNSDSVDQIQDGVIAIGKGATGGLASVIEKQPSTRRRGGSRSTTG